VTFIPKTGKANYTEAKAYRPISLSSFMLKMMENLAEKHIRDEILGLCLLHQYQFATNQGSPLKLHCIMITHIEEAMENSEVTLGAFLDIQGALDNTQFDIITKAAKRHGLEARSVVGSAPRWEAGKSQPCLQQKLWRSLKPGAAE
jgi:hypothetical protein